MNTNKLCATWSDRAQRMACDLQRMRVPTTDGLQVNRTDVIYARSYLRAIPMLANRIIALRTAEAAQAEGGAL